MCLAAARRLAHRETHGPRGDCRDRRSGAVPGVGVAVTVTRPPALLLVSQVSPTPRRRKGVSVAKRSSLFLFLLLPATVLALVAATAIPAGAFTSDTRVTV